MSKYVISLLLYIVIFSSCTTLNIQHSYMKPLLEKKSITTHSLYQEAQTRLFSKANRAINKKFKSITDKDAIPPSGDRRDYFSRAIYYWPDSTNESNRWKFRDGIVNKKSLEQTDHFTFFEAMGGIRDLSLSYHLSQNEKYAEKAFQLIDQWFVNATTKMNPHFNFAQAIPGKNNGSHWGIISSRAIIWVINGIEYLESSNSRDNGIIEEFKIWCSNFLTWLIESEFGKKQGNTKTNHSTFYDLELAELSNFTGQYEICNTILSENAKRQIELQINSEGALTAELKRTRPLHYSLFNLSAFIHLAILGDKYNIDLWDAKSDSNGSILDAVNYILKKIEEEKLKSKEKHITSNIIGLLTILNKKFSGLYVHELNNYLAEGKKLRLVDCYFIF